jgi:hypothetical protein
MARTAVARPLLAAPKRVCSRRQPKPNLGMVGPQRSVTYLFPRSSVKTTLPAGLTLGNSGHGGEP